MTSESTKHFSSKGKRKKILSWKRAKKLQKLKEGGKSSTFLTYDGAYGPTGKMLNFIQNFDATFGGEDFIKGFKLHHVAMHLENFVQQRWNSLWSQVIALIVFVKCRATIMEHFLTDQVCDNVNTTWRSLKMEQAKTAQRYVDNFWVANIKESIYKKIGFA